MANDIIDIIFNIAKSISIVLFIIWVVSSILQKKDHSALGLATIISCAITVIIYILR
jgi:hypothetical protein